MKTKVSLYSGFFCFVLSLWIIVCCAGCGGDEKTPVSPKSSIPNTPNGQYFVTLTAESNSCTNSQLFCPLSYSFTTTITVSGTSITFKGKTGTYDVADYAVIQAEWGCTDKPGGYTECRDLTYDFLFLDNYTHLKGYARWRHSEYWPLPESDKDFDCQTVYLLVGTKIPTKQIDKGGLL
jgi:hypothetical protein